ALQWTLFDGFQSWSAQRATQAQADSLQEQLRQAELAASAEVWSSYYVYENALAAHAVSVAYLKSASASYDLALESYKNGLSNMIELLNAASFLAQARSQNITARHDTFTALANLAFATGCLEKGGTPGSRADFLTPARKEQP
ncbi:MAG: TolC family protein, partial [Lentisphaerae bacterium]|nr:TolC family protein [Lentisphaerota bacterium]